MLLKDVGIDGRHHDVALAVDDERALLDLLQITVAVFRGDRAPFSKSDELSLADLGLRFRFAVQLSRGDPLEPGLARRVTRRALRKEQVQRAFLLGAVGTIDDVHHLARKFLHAFAARRAGTYEEDAPYQFGRVKHHLLRDHAADRETEQINLLQTERFDEGNNVGRGSGNRVWHLAARTTDTPIID